MLMIEPLRVRPELLVDSAAPQPEAGVRLQIKEGWVAERARLGPRLVETRLFSVAEREGARLHGFLCDSSWWLAQERTPALYRELALQPVRVSAVARVGDGVLLGRRAGRGTLELVPSGLVDATARRARELLSAEDQLLSELEDELDLPADLAAAPRPLALVDRGPRAPLELVFELRLELPHEEVLACCRQRTALSDLWEFPEILWLDRAELRRRAPEIQEAARALLVDRLGA